jgi:hypothetical protein
MDRLLSSLKGAFRALVYLGLMPPVPPPPALTLLLTFIAFSFHLFNVIDPQKMAHWRIDHLGLMPVGPPPAFTLLLTLMEVLLSSNFRACFASSLYSVTRKSGRKTAHVVVNPVISLYPGLSWLSVMAVQLAKPHDNQLRLKIATARSGEVENSMEKSRPYRCPERACLSR